MGGGRPDDQGSGTGGQESDTRRRHQGSSRSEVVYGQWASGRAHQLLNDLWSRSPTPMFLGHESREEWIRPGVVAADLRGGYPGNRDGELTTGTPGTRRVHGGRESVSAK